jgi:hypothetical protein
MQNKRSDASARARVVVVCACVLPAATTHRAAVAMTDSARRQRGMASARAHPEHTTPQACEDPKGTRLRPRSSTGSSYGRLMSAASAWSTCSGQSALSACGRRSTARARSSFASVKTRGSSSDATLMSAAGFSDSSPATRGAPSAMRRYVRGCTSCRVATSLPPGTPPPERTRRTARAASAPARSAATISPTTEPTLSCFAMPHTRTHCTYSGSSADPASSPHPATSAA